MRRHWHCLPSRSTRPLAIVSIGVLIYFIHHVSVSIQADEVVAHVGRELEDGIDRQFPGRLGRPGSESSDSPDTAGLPAAFAREARPVGAAEDGHLQLIDGDALVALASRAALLLQLERRPGHDLVKGLTMVMVWPGDRVTAALVGQLNDAFVFGSQRPATPMLLRRMCAVAPTRSRPVRRLQDRPRAACGRPSPSRVVWHADFAAYRSRHRRCAIG